MKYEEMQAVMPPNEMIELCIKKRITLQHVLNIGNDYGSQYQENSGSDVVPVLSLS